MKSLLKYAGGLALTGLLTVALTPNANAQRGFHGGGVGSVRVGGGGFRGGFGFRGGIGFRGVGFRGFYGYPAFGFRLGILPFGYYPFYFGDDLYYYYGGVFYRPYDGGGYEVTAPPVGAAVPELPRGTHPIMIDGVQYYEFNGVYYTESTDEKGKKIYVVAGKDGVLNTNGANADGQQAAPQVGDVVNQLPDGCRKVSLNGKRYYVSADDIYYEEFTDAQNNKAYRIASIPSNDQN